MGSGPRYHLPTKDGFDAESFDASKLKTFAPSGDSGVDAVTVGGVPRQMVTPGLLVDVAQGAGELTFDYYHAGDFSGDPGTIRTATPGSHFRRVYVGNYREELRTVAGASGIFRLFDLRSTTAQATRNYTIAWYSEVLAGAGGGWEHGSAADAHKPPSRPSSA